MPLRFPMIRSQFTTRNSEIIVSFSTLNRVKWMIIRFHIASSVAFFVIWFPTHKKLYHLESTYKNFVFFDFPFYSTTKKVPFFVAWILFSSESGETKKHIQTNSSPKGKRVKPIVSIAEYDVDVSIWEARTLPRIYCVRNRCWIECIIHKFHKCFHSFSLFLFRTPPPPVPKWIYRCLPRFYQINI